MEVMTVLQFLQAFTLYLLVVLWLPSLILGKMFGKFPLSVRFLFYFIIGNFYMIHLVYVLQLLKISNGLTLLIGTLFPVVKIWKKTNNISFQDMFRNLYELSFRIFSGRYGGRLMLRRARKWCVAALKYRIGKIIRFFSCRPLDSILMFSLLGLIGFLYGRNLVLYMGYGASDIPVHTLWVNAMEYQWPWDVDFRQDSLKEILASWNDIFTKGVYPFGMHNIIYYLHAVFGIDIYVLFRVFWLVQDTLIFLMPVFALKALCRTRFAAYMSTSLYLIMAFRSNTYSRFYSTLPQEAGMLFIVPAGYFLMAFLIQRRLEIKEGSSEPIKKLISTKFLAGFAMSFCLSFTTHFYDTFALAFLCLGIAIAFFFRIFRKGYFGRIVVAGLLGLLIAVLPLVLGILEGKGAQGSIGWGLNVITGANNKEEDETEETQGSESSGTEGEAEEGSDATEESNAIKEEVPNETLEEKVTRILGSVVTLYRGLQNRLVNYIFVKGTMMPVAAVFIPILILLGRGLLSFLFKKPDYGGVLWAVALHQLLLLVLLSLNYLGLPQLMDPSRASVYFAYGLPLLWGMTMDSVISLFFGKYSRSHLASLVTVGCIGGILAFIVKEDLLRSLHNPIAVWQTNSSVTCLTNIIRDRRDHTWTICSANDVTRQVHGHGYHYEAITFLQDLMYGRTAPQPTPWMYFFVEKVPINYNLAYPGSGQSVSLEGAESPLPPSRGISQYQGESRWVIMSKLYYWGEAFMKRFPNSVRVYYETDDFICYEIKQNVNRVFNFVIPYP
jgi:hypothetical protein